MNRRPVRALAALAGLHVLLLAGCGGSNNPTSPTPQIPTVAGNYSGTSTFTIVETRQTFSCPTTTTVVQTGSSVSIAPLQLGGACGNVSIPVGSGTIDSNGSLGQIATTTSVNGCPYNVAASGGFFGTGLRLSIIYSAPACNTLNFSMTLIR